MKKTPQRDELLKQYYTDKLEGMKSSHVSTRDGGFYLNEATINDLSEDKCAELNRMQNAPTRPAEDI